MITTDFVIGADYVLFCLLVSNNKSEIIFFYCIFFLHTDFSVQDCKDLHGSPCKKKRCSGKAEDLVVGRRNGESAGIGASGLAVGQFQGGADFEGIGSCKIEFAGTTASAVINGYNGEIIHIHLIGPAGDFDDAVGGKCDDIVGVFTAIYCIGGIVGHRRLREQGNERGNCGRAKARGGHGDINGARGNGHRSEVEVSILHNGEFQANLGGGGRHDHALGRQSVRPAPEEQ